MSSNARMKVVILCGGEGTRIRDVSEVMPKPMLLVGDKPILWHIMKIYAHYGLKDFVLCLGYKGWVIKEYFLNYFAKISDVTVHLGKAGEIVYHNKNDEADWSITLVETGEKSQTGARIWQARRYLEECDNFSVTYGDGVADIDINALMRVHAEAGLLGTITGVHPSGRFGEIEASNNKVVVFNEKPNVAAGLINGGFMMFKRGVFDTYFRSGEDLVLEGEVLGRMVGDSQLGVYQHRGFWQCIDTAREYEMLNQAWKNNRALWKTW